MNIGQKDKIRNVAGSAASRLVVASSASGYHKIWPRQHKRRNNLIILCHPRLAVRLFYFCSLSLGGHFFWRPPAQLLSTLQLHAVLELSLTSQSEDMCLCTESIVPSWNRFSSVWIVSLFNANVLLWGVSCVSPPRLRWRRSLRQHSEARSGGPTGFEDNKLGWK